MKVNKLDLHGKSHYHIGPFVDSFIWDCMRKNHSYADIITGNSERMKNLVIDIVKDYKLEYQIGDYYNQGYIKIILK
jgi:DNA-nicking Smr family endonuclease